MSSKFPQVAFSVPNENTYNKLIETLSKAGYNWAYPEGHDAQYSWLANHYPTPCISIRFGDLTHGDYRYFVNDLQVRIIDALNNWLEVLKTLNMTTTFENAVHTVVNDFVAANKSFSLHEVTSEVRRRVNAGEVVLSDGKPSTEGYPAQINHDEVKAAVANMNLDLDISYVNGYRVFSAKAPTLVTPISTVSNTSIIVDHIKNYVNSKMSKNLSTTVKQIQSTLRRVGNVTCEEIVDILGQNGYNVQPDSSGATHYSKYIVS